MASDARFSFQDSARPERAVEAASFLAPIDKPKGLVVRIMYWYSRRQWGKVPRPFSVFVARMPTAFGSFFGKVSKLDKKLQLQEETATLVRARVASINMCHFCMDTARWYAMKELGDSTRFDALTEYQTSPLFTEAERSALDYASELTKEKKVSPETFERLKRHYAEREICDIVWLIASEHLYNISNIGLNIGSDGLCELSTRGGRAPKTAVGPTEQGELR